MNSSDDSLTFAERAALGRTAGDLARSGQDVVAVQESAADRRPAIQDQATMFALLAWAAAFDQKERGQIEAQAWLEALRGLPVEDVRAAITEHYRTSTFPIMPAHVIRILEEGLPQ